MTYVIDMAGVTDEPTFQAKLNSVPQGADVLIKPCNVFLNQGVRFTVPAHYRFEGGSDFYSTTTNPGFRVSSSGITLEALGPVKVRASRGSGSSVQNDSNGIHIQSDDGSYLWDVAIKGPFQVTDWLHDGVMAVKVACLKINGITVRDISYSGIAILSGQDVYVEGNYINHVHLPDITSYNANAYGIAVTNNTADPVSNRVWVRNNFVHAVVTWHGIDVHGAKDVFIENNVVENCRDGIYVTYQDTTAPDKKIGAQNVLIRGNKLYGGTTGNISGFGIYVSGNQDASEYVMGVTIEGNVLEQFGWVGGSSSHKGATIHVSACLNYTIKGNMIRSGRYRGIQISSNLAHTQTIGLISGNYVGSLSPVAGDTNAGLYTSGAYVSSVVDGNTFYNLNFAAIHVASASPSSNYQVRVARSNNFSYISTKFGSTNHIDAGSGL